MATWYPARYLAVAGYWISGAYMEKVWDLRYQGSPENSVVRERDKKEKRRKKRKKREKSRKKLRKGREKENSAVVSNISHLISY